MANILAATTKTLGTHAFGTMFVGIPEEQFDKAFSYLKTCEGISVEEVESIG